MIDFVKVFPQTKLNKLVLHLSSTSVPLSITRIVSRAIKSSYTNVPYIADNKRQCSVGNEAQQFRTPFYISILMSKLYSGEFQSWGLTVYWKMWMQCSLFRNWHCYGGSIKSRYGIDSQQTLLYAGVYKFWKLWCKIHQCLIQR